MAMEVTRVKPGTSQITIIPNNHHLIPLFSSVHVGGGAVVLVGAGGLTFCLVFVWFEFLSF